MNLRPLIKKFALASTVMLAGFTAPLLAQTADDYTLPVVKRFYMMQADARCHLLDAATSQALKAGYLQARNDALRAGLSMAYLAPWLDKARMAAGQTDCASPQLASEADLARGGYRRFMALPHVAWNSGRTEWAANRAFGDDTAWRLVQYQNTDQADLAFGLYGTLHQNSFTLMAGFHDGVRPYSARLLVRNTDIVATGRIDRTPYALTTEMPLGFSDYSSLSFMARNISETTAALRPEVKANLAGFSLSGDFVGKQAPEDALRFDFPARAWMAIAKLDPREDIVVEFNTAKGPRYARFEVGDFLTGLSYVALPSSYTNNHPNTAL